MDSKQHLELNMGYYSYVGDLNKVLDCISKGANNWNEGLRQASKGNNQHLVDFFIEKGADNWNEGLAGAVEGNNQHLVDFFIEKGANNWNVCLYIAVENKNIEIAKLLIEKGADTNYIKKHFICIHCTDYKDDNLMCNDCITHYTNC